MKSLAIILTLFLSSTLGYSLPKVTLQNLHANNLKDDGGKIGAFVVQDLGVNYKNAVKEFLEKSPNCFESHPELPKLEMDDGSIRTTFGTTSHESLDCTENEMNVIMDTFDKVDNAVMKMIRDATGKIFEIELPN